jgi:ATP adenylyltransferase/5',5'''-P-1,P-4-tetraphosphate phosphorylase II
MREFKPRTEVGDLTTLVFYEAGNRSGKNQQPMHSQRIKEQITDQSAALLLERISREVVESKGRDARILTPVPTDRE